MTKSMVLEIIDRRSAAMNKALENIERNGRTPNEIVWIREARR